MTVQRMYNHADLPSPDPGGSGVGVGGGGTQVC